MRRTHRLSAKEQVLYDKLIRRTGTDITILELHKALYPDDDNASPRMAQMRVGSVVSRVNNKKFETHRIEPGNIKRTYRIVVLHTKK